MITAIATGALWVGAGIFWTYAVAIAAEIVATDWSEGS